MEIAYDPTPVTQKQIKEAVLFICLGLLKYEVPTPKEKT